MKQFKQISGILEFFTIQNLATSLLPRNYWFKVPSRVVAISVPSCLYLYAKTSLRNHWHEKIFHIQVYLHAHKIHFHMKGFA